MATVHHAWAAHGHPLLGAAMNAKQQQREQREQQQRLRAQQHDQRQQRAADEALLDDGEIEALLAAADFDADFGCALVDASPETAALDFATLDTGGLLFDEDGLIIDCEVPSSSVSPISSISSLCPSASASVSSIPAPSLSVSFKNQLYYFVFDRESAASNKCFLNQWDPVVASSELTLFLFQFKSVFQIQSKSIVIEFPQLELVVDENSSFCAEYSLENIMEAWATLKSSMKLGAESNEPLHIIVTCPDLAESR
ncbi:hypothetical protein BDR26DRAFT_917022 [Obelidium mucronatum]|nr:hypothetical protein BDR26DRAFT_917022 [Obelidium mucronatum]